MVGCPISQPLLSSYLSETSSHVSFTAKHQYHFYSLSLLDYFIYNIAYLDLTKTRKEDNINIAVGFLNVIQWLLAASFPIIMVRLIWSHVDSHILCNCLPSLVCLSKAVRFTLAGRGLTRLGLEVAQRPYNYSTQSDIELQYFLNYMSATKYSVRVR